MLIPAQEILSAAARVRPSNKGFISVSENGDETTSNSPTGIKRARGRPRKTAAEVVQLGEVEAEPPTKRPRGRPPKETKPTVREDASSPPRKRGRPKKSEMTSEEPVSGAEAEIEDDATPVCHVSQMNKLTTRCLARRESERRCLLSPRRRSHPRHLVVGVDP